MLRGDRSLDRVARVDEIREQRVSLARVDMAAARSTASGTSAWCSASTAATAEPAARANRVEPSMSVNSIVTTPSGVAVIAVDA